MFSHFFTHNPNGIHLTPLTSESFCLLTLLGLNIGLRFFPFFHIFFATHRHSVHSYTNVSHDPPCSSRFALESVLSPQVGQASSILLGMSPGAPLKPLFVWMPNVDVGVIM